MNRIYLFKLEDLVEHLEYKDRFNWKIDRIKSGPGIVLYLLGSPKAWSIFKMYYYP